MIIRPEQECDYDEIRSVVKRSFAGAEHTDSDEHNLIDRLLHVFQDTHRDVRGHNACPIGGAS